MLQSLPYAPQLSEMPAALDFEIEFDFGLADADNGSVMFDSDVILVCEVLAVLSGM